MFAVIAALISSVAYGVSDFYAAVASRKLPALQVTLLSYTAATVVGGALLFVWPGTWSIETVLVGGAAGVLAGLGFWAMYAALGVGPVSVVAPLVAVAYAAVPVAWSLATGTQLTLLAWTGIALGLLAVLALSAHPKDEGEASPSLTPVSITLSLLAALAMGFAVIVLDMAPHDSGVTSAFVEVIAGLSVLSIAFVFAKRPTRESINTKAIWHSVLAGALLGVANAALVLALIAGELAVVGILSSLYPLSTIALAAMVLRERVTKIQGVGIVLAVTAAVLLGTA